MDRFNELKSLISSMEYEHKKWTLRKIKASGQRVRNNLLEVKKIATLLRKEISDEIKSMPVRSKPRAIPKPTTLNVNESIASQVDVE